MGVVVDSYRFAAGGGGGIAYVGKGTYATSTASTSHTVQLDAGHATGDTLIVAVGGAGAASVSSATGWTKVGGANGFAGTDSWGEAWYRVADGSEGSTAAFTISDPVNTGSICFAYSGVNSVADTSANWTRVSSNTPASYTGTLPATDSGDWVVFVAHRNSISAATLTEPSGSTEIHDEGGGMPSCMAVAHRGPESSAPAANTWTLVGGDGNYSSLGPVLLKGI